MPRLRIRYSFREPRYVVLWARWICLMAAAACFVWGASVWWQQHWYQKEAEESFKELIREPMPATAPAHPTPKREPDRDKPLAKLEIARLQVFGYVEDGLDARTLGRAIGHSSKSAKPGERGNIVLAAHRDTFFAGLRDVRVGDIVDVQASNGEKYQYRVSKVLVLDPKETWVMRSSPKRDMLTLITCYPFHFIGNAPNRLVVQALPVQAPEVAARRSGPRA